MFGKYLSASCGNKYRIARNFRGYQFSQMLDFDVFSVLMFKDRAFTLTMRYCIVCGKGKIFEVTNFAVSHRSAKTTKIDTLDNFQLYGNTMC